MPKSTQAGSDVVLERLMQLHPKLIDLSLERLHRLLERLGHPHRHVPPVVHVAGTNGKGSVIACMRAALMAAGRTVHVYTSPHLVRFHERIEIAGRVIAEDRLMGLLEECETANRGEPITFFEITTAAAYLAFSRDPADILLLETGLGGRLDATNVVDEPLVSVITPISLDHQQFLGTTRAAIAGEKAGIIKSGVPVVIAPQDDEAMEVLLDRAGALGAPAFAAGRDFTFHASAGGGLEVRGPAAKRTVLPAPALAGRHQLANAATAVVALGLTGRLAPGDDALAGGMRQARWPARLQHLHSGSLVDRLGCGQELWLDGGHNPAAGAILADMARAWGDRPLDVIIGMMNTKDPAGFIHPLAPFIRRAVALSIPGEKNTLDATATAAVLAAEGVTATVADNIGEAVSRLAEGQGERSRILICGSLYLAGRVLAANGFTTG